MVGGCLALSLLLLAPYPAAAADISPAMQKVVAEARKEGTVTLTWGSTILGGQEGAREIIDGTNAMFGTKLDISFVPGPNLVGLGFQVATESKAGRPASTDLLITPTAVIPVLTGQKHVLPVDWQALMPDRVVPKMVEFGSLVKFATEIFGIIYNTKLVSNPPQSLADLLKPEFKGKIATTPYAAGFDLMTANDIMGEKGLDFMRKFIPQTGGLLRCTDFNRIANGEFAIFALDCGNGALEVKEQGLPVDVVVPKDFALISYFYLAVPKNAAHPNAAILVAAYLLSKEGQELHWRTGKYDLHLFPDSHMKGRVDEAIARSGKVYEASGQWYVDHPEMAERRNEMMKIIRSGR